MVELEVTVDTDPYTKGHRIHTFSRDYVKTVKHGKCLTIRPVKVRE